MDKDLRGYFIVMVAVSIVIVIGAGVEKYFNYLETSKAMEHGYIQETDPVSHEPIWIKKD